jgi:hypothetical protein
MKTTTLEQTASASTLEVIWNRSCNGGSVQWDPGGDEEPFNVTCETLEELRKVLLGVIDEELAWYRELNLEEQLAKRKARALRIIHGGRRHTVRGKPNPNLRLLQALEFEDDPRA